MVKYVSVLMYPDSDRVAGIFPARDTRELADEDGRAATAALAGFSYRVEERRWTLSVRRASVA